MTAPLVAPGRGRGMLDVLSNRYLLRLIVRKEYREALGDITSTQAWGRTFRENGAE